MQIEYLADRMEFAPLLATWHYDEWKGLLPEWSLDVALADLKSHTRRIHIPTTFIAIEQECVIGSASLLETDLEGWGHLSPWLASVYVIPQRRKEGIGRLLVTRAVQEGCFLGVPELYLFTAGQQAYYERLGWSVFQLARHYDHPIVIMRRETRDVR